MNEAFNPTPGVSYNPYATNANPYAPNPMAFSGQISPSNGIFPARQTNTTQQQNAQNAANYGARGINPFILIPSRENLKDVTLLPNETRYIMAQNACEFYVKTADNMGIANTRYFRFAEFFPDAEAQQAMQAAAANALTREEVEQLIEQRLDAFVKSNTPKPSAKSKKEVEE